MKPSIHNKLESLTDRLEEINALLADPEVISDQNRFRSLSQEYAQVNPVVSCFRQYQTTLSDIETARQMLEEEDKEMQEMAQQELDSANARKEDLEQKLQILMLCVKSPKG